MLLVKTFVTRSIIPGAGNGCFAAEAIPKGTKIWEFNPFLDRVFTEQNVKTMNDLDAEFVNTYAYKHNGLYFLCVDNARFFNHSDDRFNTIDPNDEYATYALRNIHKGEEMLSNYATFGVTEDDLKHNMDNLE